jgi:5'-3' exonuclease
LVGKLVSYSFIFDYLTNYRNTITPDANPSIPHTQQRLIFTSKQLEDSLITISIVNRSLEAINFYLSLMREYFDLKFHIEPILPFEYNLECVIDFFILLAIFVGNDFLPNLPDLHIHENGLERLFDVYKKVLPGLGVFLLYSVCVKSKLMFLISRWLCERERVDKHEAATGCAGRDGIVGAGGI